MCLHSHWLCKIQEKISVQLQPGLKSKVIYSKYYKQSQGAFKVLGRGTLVSLHREVWPCLLQVANTFERLCQSISLLFTVLGIYNFAQKVSFATQHICNVLNRVWSGGFYKLFDHHKPLTHFNTYLVQQWKIIGLAKLCMYHHRLICHDCTVYISTLSAQSHQKELQP